MPTSKSWLHQPKKVGSRNKELWEKPFESFLPNLLNLAPTLRRMKSSISHRAWKFHFFSNFIFAKFKVHLGLHIHHWSFCLTPKGLWIPYMEFWEFGQAAVNAINFSIFWNFLWRCALQYAMREYKFRIFWTYGSKVMGIWSF
jgi:hypothetical protein